VMTLLEGDWLIRHRVRKNDESMFYSPGGLGGSSEQILGLLGPVSSAQPGVDATTSNCH